MLLNEKGKLVTDIGEIVEFFKKYVETRINRQGQGSANENMTYYYVESDIEVNKQEKSKKVNRNT